MTKKRDHPYVWVTWLPHIMLGAKASLWGTWFKTNYQDLPKQPPDFRVAVWTTEHAERLGKLSDALTAAGYGVSRENENLFRVRRGSGLTIGGRPDLVSWSPQGLYTVYDVKTGARSDSHIIQVMLCMALLPFSKGFVGKTFAESILYNDGGSYVNIPATAVDEAFRKRTGYYLDLVSGPAPARSPSPGDCRFCDLTAADCPERVAWNEKVSRQLC